MAALGPFEPTPAICVAVSGGPDSMALAWLAARWARARDGAATALLIDHGLRPESAKEVTIAAKALGGLGIATAASRIPGPPPATGRPAWARAERYRLLEQETAARGVLHLLVGHHLDDQAETLTLNLARGSGTRGLAAIRPQRMGDRIRVLRPLLGMPKARLVATAHAAGLPVADDPSNRDMAYARTRARHRLADGVSTAGLSATAARLAVDDAAIEHVVAGLAAAAVAISPAGWIAIDRARLLAAPDSAAIRLLGRAADAVGGKIRPPRQARVVAALDGLRGMKVGRRTLAGAEIDWGNGAIRIWREAGKRPPPSAPIGSLLTDTLVWDGRFRVKIPSAAPAGGCIGPLGYKGLRAVEAIAAQPAWVGQAPRRALATIPALWVDDWLVAAPSFGMLQESPGQAMLGATHFTLGATYRPRRPIAPQSG